MLTEKETKSQKKTAKKAVPTPSADLNTEVSATLQKQRKTPPMDDKYVYLTPARLRRSHTLINPVDTRIILPNESYTHLQIRGYMMGCTWDEYLRELIAKDINSNPHTTITKKAE